MKKLVYTFGILLSVATSVAAQLQAERGGLIYETMRDEYEQNLLNMSEYEISDPSQYISVPALAAPFGFTPTHMEVFANAQPLDGVQLVRTPYSNHKGAATLEYRLDLPPVNHNMKPQLTLTYNSDLFYGLLGRGWDISLPKITMDSFAYNGTRITYQINGVPMVDEKNSDNNPQDLFANYLAVNKKGEVTHIERFGSINDCYWEATDYEGIKHVYGLVKKNRDDDGQKKANVSVIVPDVGTEVVEWFETYAENAYGDYIEYRYDEEKHRLDTILIGVVGESDPRIMVCLSWLDNISPKPVVKGYLGNFTLNSRINSISVFYVKDFRTANSVPKELKDRFDKVATYSFSYKKGKYDVLKSINSAFGKLSYTHKFDYYNDTAEVKRYRQFRDDYFNFSVDSLIKDRTDLLKTIHTPLGGCITIDYDYAGPARMIGDTVVELPLPYDTLVAYHDRKDTLLLDYFHRRDTLSEETKGKLVMSSLWLNDAFLPDGQPSRNTFTYEHPIKNGQDRFCGFETIITHNQMRNDTSFTDYRILSKTYDTTWYDRLSNILNVCVINPESNDTLSRIDYDYDIHDMDGIYHFMMLKSRQYQSDAQSYKWIYTYDYANECPDLVKASFTNSIDNNHNKTLKFGYFHDLNYRMKGVPSSIQLLDGSNKVIESTSFEYGTNPKPSEKQNRFLVKKMIQHVDNNQTIATEFKYDSNGNMIRRTMPGEEGKRLTYDYLYDRRFNLFITQVDDSRGYRSEWNDYDYFHGKPQTIIDRNGQKMVQKHDALGRLDTIIAPNELEAGVSYSLRYVYPQLSNSNPFNHDSLHADFLDSLILNVPDTIYANIIPDSIKKGIADILELDTFDIIICDGLEWSRDTFNILVQKDSINIPECFCDIRIEPIKAHTYRYNAMNEKEEKDIIASVMSDGFGRVIQTQSRMNVYHPTTVNETTEFPNLQDVYVADAVRHYDAFARLDAISLPVNTGKNNVNIVTQSNTMFSRTYDLIDRKTKVELFNGDSILLSYGENNQVYATGNHVNDSLQYSTDGLLMAHHYANQYAESYDYDVRGKLVSQHKGDLQTTWKYDRLGRLTEMSDPTLGTYRYTYDMAGNLVSKTSSNLTGASVLYKYDNYDQLTDIIYPNHPSDSIHFIYGDKNAPFNRVGQIALASNATGVHEYYYGRQGEINKERKTVIVPDGPVETFTTQTEYDTWNRLKTVVYPDGEILTYKYNVNGLPTSAVGNKAYEYNYVQQAAYDEFGRETHYKYCNGAETFFVYDEQKQDMKLMLIRKDQNTPFYKQDRSEMGAIWELNTFTQQWISGMHQYSPLGNLTMESLNLLNSSNMVDIKSGVGLGFTYDKNNCVSSHWRQATDDQNNNEAYSYEHKKTPEGLDVCQFGTNTSEGTDHPATLFAYDSNGNRVSLVETMADEDETLDSIMDRGGSSVKMMSYDDDNRMQAMSDNGYITTYWYDVTGNRSLVMQGGQQAVYVNSQQALNEAYIPSSYQIYLNRYFEKGSDSLYVKHIWLGNNRMVSKVGNNGSYGSSPSRIERAGTSVESVKLSYDNLYRKAQQSIASRYSEVVSRYPESGRKCPSQALLRNANVDNGNDAYEESQYYYHTDRNSNTMLMTDLKCDFIQQTLMLLTGEIVSLEKNGTWISPYFFNGCTYDFITGLYYKDGSYFDSKYDYNRGRSVWYETYHKEINNLLNGK